MKENSSYSSQIRRVSCSNKLLSYKTPMILLHLATNTYVRLHLQGRSGFECFH